MSELANRLRKNQRRLGAWSKKNGVSCYRVYDRDLPSVPIVIDVYETVDAQGDGARTEAAVGAKWMHVSVFEPRHGIEQAAIDQWMKDANEALTISAERTVVKRRSGGVSYETYAKSEDAKAQRVIVREGGLRFLVNLTDYADTGLFLDHRTTRALVAEESAGKRVLNLFAYTASFSLYAAKGGAQHTVSVDLSPTYSQWARDNFALNAALVCSDGVRMSDKSNDTVTADVIEWLSASRERFDLVIVDPPTVSKSKRAASFDVQRDHRRLLELAIARVDDGGVVWFSTNFTGFTFDAPEGVTVEEKTQQTVPFDFPRRPPIHRSWRIEV